MEAFFRDHQFTLSAISSIATFAAVIVSLGVALQSARAQRPKIRATMRLQRSKVSAYDLAYVAIQVTNTGSVPVTIYETSFIWRCLIPAATWIMDPVDQFSATPVKAKQYPVVIAPNDGAVFIIEDIAGLREAFAGARRKTLANWIILRLMRPRVVLPGGQSFPAKLDPAVRKAIVGGLTLPLGVAGNGGA